MVVLGFDPGLTGAGAIVGKVTGPEVFDLPTRVVSCEGKKDVKLIDERALYAILLERLGGVSSVHAITEALAYGGQRDGGFNKVQTSVSQGRTRGTIETVIRLVGLELEEVTPGAWKRLYGLGGKGMDKKEATLASRQTVLRLYPDLADYMQLAKDHNRAEAVLIAHWYRRELLQRGERAARVSEL